MEPLHTIVLTKSIFQQRVVFKTNFKTFVYSSNFTANFDRFSIGKFDIGIALTPLKKLSFLVQADGGSKIGTNSTPFLISFLGIWFS